MAERQSQGMESGEFFIPCWDEEEASLPCEGLGRARVGVPGDKNWRSWFTDCNQHVGVLHHHDYCQTKKGTACTQQWRFPTPTVYAFFCWVLAFTSTVPCHLQSHHPHRRSLWSVNFHENHGFSCNIFLLRRTMERVASAIRQRMKQKRPQRMHMIRRTVPALLPSSVLERLGARSACVTAITAGMIYQKGVRLRQDHWWKIGIWALFFSPVVGRDNCRIAWRKGCLKAKDSWVQGFTHKLSHKGLQKLAFRGRHCY